jgi:hypothetical protein
MGGLCTMRFLKPLFSSEGPPLSIGEQIELIAGFQACGGDTVATRPKNKKAALGRLSENLIKSEACLVAGIGFEPMTFRL